jgi:hypothetical protein
MTGAQHYDMAEYLLNAATTDLPRPSPEPPHASPRPRTREAIAVPVGQGPTGPPRSSPVPPGDEKRKRMIAAAQVHAILALAAVGLPTPGQ